MHRGRGAARYKNTSIPFSVTHLSVITLQETHLDERRASRFIRSLGRGWLCFFQPSIGSSSGTLLAWKSIEVKVQPLLTSSQCLTMVLGFLDREPFLFSSVYASTNPNVRCEFLKSFDNFDISPFPWLICGDFNCVLNSCDKQGGLPFRLSKSEVDFRDFTRDLGLIDLGFTGNPYTWCNNRGSASRIMIRLDRVFCNTAWMHIFGCSSIKHLNIGISYHNPLLCNVSVVGCKSKFFKFGGFWTEYPRWLCKMLGMRCLLISAQILQQALDREKIWSRLTTSESIEVLEKDLAIFGFFIALGRSTQSFLSSNGIDMSNAQIESIISWYLIGGGVLYYPQLSSISSYQLYVEVVCEELEWLPFYRNTISSVTSDNQDKQEGINKNEVICQVLKVCSYWITSFIKYSKWLENPSHRKAARFLSRGHSMLNECTEQLGVLMNMREDTVEFQVQKETGTKISDQLALDSFDETLESVEGALKRLEDLLQELHLSSPNHGREHLRAACSDLERIRKLKKEAEFLEASFRAKAASLEQSDCSLSSASKLGRIEDSGKKPDDGVSVQKCEDEKPHGFWIPLIRSSNKKKEPGLFKADSSDSNGNINNQDEQSTEIRRFKLLRDELIELERRVQRSTDESRNEGPDFVDEHASAKFHMLVPGPKKENIIAKSMEKIKETTTDVWQGTQLLAVDLSAAVALMKRAATGDELTEKEKRALRRTLTDLASVIPIGFLMLLPIPSTYAPERLDLLRQLEKPPLPSPTTTYPILFPAPLSFPTAHRRRRTPLIARRRGDGPIELPPSSGAKAEALDNLKAVGAAPLEAGKPPSPAQALLGGIAAGVIALILYKFTITIESSLNRQIDL
ncbi:hypothetical protein Cni_G11208 [Canna indica]|uniref:Endonuclease/exonuclease/phosphatase domain-containing protein n=1 Tax=Canna indica TaxID=4628 RepID=A0AAQ3Q9A8_9LILI|nr:hypothetical protein Cni_G11208 [Canna indica]